MRLLGYAVSSNAMDAIVHAVSWTIAGLQM